MAQRLDSDSLLKQSARVSGVRGPGAGAGVWGLVSGVRHLACCVWGSALGVGRPESRNSGMLFITNDHASLHLW